MNDCIDPSFFRLREDVGQAMKDVVRVGVGEILVDEVIQVVRHCKLPLGLVEHYPPPLRFQKSVEVVKNWGDADIGETDASRETDCGRSPA